MSHPLILVNGKANLVFHDVSPAPESRYTVPLQYVRATAQQVRLDGLSQNVRFYFDDGYASARSTTELLRREYPEIEVIAAITITAIGESGYLDWEDLETMRSWGVQIVGHGYQHVRLTSYVDGVAVKTPANGSYRRASEGQPQLSANEVLFQLTETRDALKGAEFVLPYGAYNSDVVAINERHQLFEILSTADYGWDLGQELRPRMLLTTGLSPKDIPALLASPWLEPTSR